VAARSKAWVCGRLVAGVAGSNPSRGMDVCVLCLYVVLSCVGRGLCDGLITRPEESYRVYVCVWSRNPEKGGQRSILDYKRLWILIILVLFLYISLVFPKQLKKLKYVVDRGILWKLEVALGQQTSAQAWLSRV
jgi:hypothetical protein